MNFCSFNAKVRLRTKRAYLGQLTAPKATTALWIPPCKTAAIAMAKIKLGKARQTSARRMHRASAFPP